MGLTDSTASLPPAMNSEFTRMVVDEQKRDVIVANHRSSSLRTLAQPHFNQDRRGVDVLWRTNLVVFALKINIRHDALLKSSPDAGR